MVCSRALLSLLVLPLVLTTFAALPMATSGEMDIAPGQSGSISLHLAGDAQLTYLVSVTKGETMNVLLMDAANYSLYESGQPYSILPISRNNIYSIHEERELTKGSYYLVIENTAPVPLRLFYEYLIDYHIIGRLGAKIVVAVAMTVGIALLAAFIYLPRYLRR